MKPAAQKRQPHSQPRLASTRYMSPNTASGASTSEVVSKRVEVARRSAARRAAARAVVAHAAQVAGRVVLGREAVRPVGAAHAVGRSSSSAVAAVGAPAPRRARNSRQHLLGLADQEEIDEVGERLGIEEGRRPAGDDERRVVAARGRGASGDAGEREAVEHVEVVGLERDREREDVEVARPSGRSRACAACAATRRAARRAGRRARTVTRGSVGEQAVDRLEAEVRHRRPGSVFG